MTEHFTLVILPDGSAILTTPRDLDDDEAIALRDDFDRWRSTPRGVAILGNTVVEHATSIEIDLPRWRGVRLT